jgi:hypothetical protein
LGGHVILAFRHPGHEPGSAYFWRGVLDQADTGSSPGLRGMHVTFSS